MINTPRYPLNQFELFCEEQGIVVNNPERLEAAGGLMVESAEAMSGLLLSSLRSNEHPDLLIEKARDAGVTLLSAAYNAGLTIAQEAKKPDDRIILLASALVSQAKILAFDFNSIGNSVSVSLNNDRASVIAYWSGMISKKLRLLGYEPTKNSEIAQNIMAVATKDMSFELTVVWIRYYKNLFPARRP